MNEKNKSQYAINEYLHLNTDNKYPHDEKIVIKKNGAIEYKGSQSAWARIETNYCHVDIAWDEDYLSEKYYEAYRNDYQKIRFDGERLIVYAQDKLGEKIEILIG